MKTDELLCEGYIVGINTTKNGKSILTYIVTDEKSDTPYSKGYLASSCWLEDSKLFDKTDIEKHFLKKVTFAYCFVKDFRGMFQRKITSVYDENGEIIA